MVVQRSFIGGVGHSTSSLHLPSRLTGLRQSSDNVFFGQGSSGRRYELWFPTSGYPITASAASGNSLSQSLTFADLCDNSLPDESQQFIHK